MRNGCLPIRAFALILAGLLAATQSYAAEEKPPPNRVERAAKKAAKGMEKAAKGVEKAAKRAGKAVEHAADKTDRWIKKHTE